MPVLFTESEIVDLAKQVEATGEAFYDEAFRHVTDDRVRQVFRFLRDEERRHGELFETFLGVVPQHLAEARDDEHYRWYLQTLAEGRVFEGSDHARKLARYFDTEEDAVRYAIDMEGDTILFLQQLRDAVRERAVGVIDRIVVEERRHVKVLTHLLAALGESPVLAK